MELSLPSLSKIIKSLGFRYKKTQNRKCLCEMSHIVSKRHEFLRNYIKNLKSESPKPFVFLDETWIFSKGGEKRSWQDNSVRCYQQPTKCGSGKRYIIVHAGGKMGFIPEAGQCFASGKKSDDYHENMNAVFFEKWFEESILKKLEEPSIIILDNASYHSRRKNPQPTGSWLKNDIIRWLNEHHVHIPADIYLKSDLLKLAKESGQTEKCLYYVDELAHQYGHEILRLPPYHCHFNPIELIWGVAKNYFDKNIAKLGSKEEDVLKMWEEALDQIPSEKWVSFVEHTEKIIINSSEQEKIIDEIRPLIFTVNTEDSEDEDSDSFEDF